ncbi:hypothetical protein RRG08_045451 [Elysia crispata]|uniref:Uncharacterized protein n=1 Tax=Elysia crispata TaxID=231223 RepID=A0AAE1AY77_9GAST|nr:hypothetical protein RRG08_045451 [Elysia crispata]
MTIRRRGSLTHKKRSMAARLHDQFSAAFCPLFTTRSTYEEKQNDRLLLVAIICYLPLEESVRQFLWIERMNLPFRIV